MSLEIFENAGKTVDNIHQIKNFKIQLMYFDQSTSTYGFRIQHARKASEAK